MKRKNNIGFQAAVMNRGFLFPLRTWNIEKGTSRVLSIKEVIDMLFLQYEGEDYYPVIEDVAGQLQLCVDLSYIYISDKHC